MSVHQQGDTLQSFKRKASVQNAFKVSPTAWTSVNDGISVTCLTLQMNYQVKEVITTAVQKGALPKEFEALTTNKPVPLSSNICCLSPTLQNNLICSSCSNANLDIEEKNPAILLRDDHVSLLLVRHHHAQIKHQGCHLTEEAVRAARLWLLGGKGLST